VTNKLLSSKKSLKLTGHKPGCCPSCRQLGEKDIIDRLGECLSCDHVNGDVMSDLLNDSYKSNNL